MQIILSIQNRIYELRGERVMLDFDLATLYEVETKVLNQAVKRNNRRFPSDFMFQLSKEEYERLSLEAKSSSGGRSRSQFVTLNIVNDLNSSTNADSLRSQFVTLKNPGRGRNLKYLPYAFTEQGVAMLSGILNSDKAISMNIAIMRAFVEIRRLTLQQMDLKQQLKEIKDRLGAHDVQLNQIYDAMENLLDEKAAERKWSERERIGFRKE
ncbi:MAG: ORF6N domain-containing protein [Bacteroidota bacterium]